MACSRTPDCATARARGGIPSPGAAPCHRARLRAVPEAETTTELAPERAAELTRDGARLIDVRGADEHEAGHIPGDELIPFDQLKARAGDLDPAAPVVLYCRSGDR